MREVVTSGFLAITVTGTTGLLFGAPIGVIWLATLAVTIGMVGPLFRPYCIDTVSGVVFPGHQSGVFPVAWWAGGIFESTGSHRDVCWTAMVLSVVATLIHWRIDDRPRESGFTPVVQPR